MLGNTQSRKGDIWQLRDSTRKASCREEGGGQKLRESIGRAKAVKWRGGTLHPVPTSAEVTRVSALSDQFLLLTLKIKIKCITIDQFTGIWYICFGDVKQNEVTSLCVLPELE